MGESNYKSGHELVAEMNRLCDIDGRGVRQAHWRYAMRLGAAQLENALLEIERLREARSSAVEPPAHNEPVAGSNPAAPTE